MRTARWGIGEVELGIGDFKCMLYVSLLWIGMSCVADPRGNFPVNDDWAYAYAARSILETGRFALTGFSAPNLLPQAYWGALFCLPFGFSFQALRVSTLTLGLAGLITTYLLLRELGADRLTACVGAMTAGANPLYLQLSATFMTDVPFTTASTAALWLYTRGAARQQAAPMLLAYAFAAVALLIRQFGIVLPIAFGAAFVIQNGCRVRTLMLATIPIALFLSIHMGFQHWVVATGRAPAFAETLGDLAHVSVVERLSETRRFALAMLPYPALFTLPFLTYLLCTHRLVGDGRYWSARAFWSATGVLGLAIFLALAWKSDLLPAFGNVLLPYGLGPITLHDTYIKHANIPVAVYATGFWALLTVFSACGTGLFLLVAGRALLVAGLGIIRAWRSDQNWPEVLMVTYVVATISLILVMTLLFQVFDRYIVSLIAPLCALLKLNFEARPRVRYSILAGNSALVACALLSAVATHDYFAFARVRWGAIQSLILDGVRPDQIDAGFEFSGWNLFQTNYRSPPGKSWWWIVDDRYMVSLGLLPGYTELRRYSFRHWLWVAQYDIFVLSRAGHARRNTASGISTYACAPSTCVGAGPETPTYVGK